MSSVRDTDKIVKVSEKPTQGPRHEEKQNVRDTDPITNAQVTPEAKYTESPERKTSEHEICLICQNLMALNGTCKVCGWSRTDIKKRAFSAHHATGDSGF